MDYTQALKDAGLPVVSAITNAYGKVVADFERELTATEWQKYLDVVDPSASRLSLAEGVALSIPGWAKWTQSQFSSWCDQNLMTDAQIDALTLNTALKTNLKTNNAFTRNAGKMLIALRDQTWPDLPDK